MPASTRSHHVASRSADGGSRPIASGSSGLSMTPARNSNALPRFSAPSHCGNATYLFRWSDGIISRLGRGAATLRSVAGGPRWIGPRPRTGPVGRATLEPCLDHHDGASWPLGRGGWPGGGPNAHVHAAWTALVRPLMGDRDRACRLACLFASAQARPGESRCRGQGRAESPSLALRPSMDFASSLRSSR